MSEARSKLAIVPCELLEANAFVVQHHRHHAPVVGHKFSLAVVDEAATVRGVAIVGRPVSRMLDDGLTLEVTRVATDGCPNACSALYGAVRRASFSLGYKRMITYTLATEDGASLRGVGWKLIGEAGGGRWSREKRPRLDLHPTQGKLSMGSVFMTDRAALVTRLRELAAKATPGPWRVDYDRRPGGAHQILFGRGLTLVFMSTSSDETDDSSDHDAAFIAACDPQTIISLCDALAAQEALDADAQRGQALIDGLADDAPATLTCQWKEDEDGNWWTGCGEGFVFTADGGPFAHNFRHCPYCGKHTAAALFPHDGSRP